MNNDGGKKSGWVRAVAAFLLLASIALGVWAFYNAKLTRSDGSVYVFDGWIYGREDQKKASAALAEAGLTDYVWRDGKLSAPIDKKGDYQKVLASSGAYPKAPSELRVDAVREMSVFESESKTRFRELNACAQQLERTIEQMRGVEYATVGVRSRREQAGFSTKNVITASVGIACSKDRELDADVLSAITVATKHQLGIDDVANISIIDLREGKSYFGVENAVGSNADVALTSEKERIEKYWRDKYLEAFGDIKNLRVSVVADVAYSSDDFSEAGADKDVAQSSKSPIMSASFAEVAPQVVEVLPVEPRRLISAPVKGRFETLDEPDEFAGKQYESNVEKSFQDSRNKSLADQEDEEIDEDALSKGFALLGNPNKARVDATGIRRRRARALIETKALIETDGKRLLDDVALKTVAQFHWLEGASSLDATPLFTSAFGDDHVSNDGIKTVRQKFLMGSAANTPLCSGAYCSRKLRDEDDLIFKPMTAARQIGEFVLAALDGREGTIGTLSNATTLRSIAVHIAVPKSYLRSVASREVNTPETFANDREVEVLAEIKRFAIDLFRPTSERLGWTDRELDRWFVVSAFSDVDVASETSVPPSEATTSNTSGSHTASYVEELGEELIPSHGGMTIVSSNEPSQSDGASSSFLDDRIAEISQTVASGMETLSQESEDEAVNFHLLSQKLTLVWKVLKSYVHNPIYRNIGTATAAALCLCCIFGVNRHLHSKRTARRRNYRSQKGKNKKEGETSFDKKGSESSAMNDVSKKNLDEYASEFDEYDDELEGELQKMIASRNTKSASRPQSSEFIQKKPSSPSGEYWDKRREALDVIAKYPERAAATLQNWVRNA